jgi:Fe-S-cluster containining protein
MFPCTGCGQCCKRIKDIHYLFPAPFTFPYKHINGVCEKLVDNKCSVYDDRPLICNIDKMIEYREFDKEEYYAENIAACNQIMDEDGIDQSFRIKI